MKKIGLYVHIPFCAGKCPYCDFYSFVGNELKYDLYTKNTEEKILQWGRKLKRNADTLYFGGGTPSILGAERLVHLLQTANSVFGDNISEITAEVNPEKKDFDFEFLRKGGFNRISIGLQSANDNELSALGRLHDSNTAKLCIEKAKSAGFENISLDLMIAVPYQTYDSLKYSVEFCVNSGAKHISAYILKIEERTPFAKMRDKIKFYDDDMQADMYEYLCSLMKEYGYNHYEISNFAKDGYESRHNLKYWLDEEYIGIGASAHSFIDGKRFYYPRNIQSFFNDEITDDGNGGNPEEYIMLGLRLSRGIVFKEFYNRYGYSVPTKYINKAKELSKYNLTEVDENRICLTEKGFLLSNQIISNILE